MIGATNARGLCPQRLDRRYCKQPWGHDGPCGYKNPGGGWVLWWGTNVRPVGWIDTYADALTEVFRLRILCEQHGVDWRAGVTTPGF